LLGRLDGALSKKFVAFIWHGIVDLLVASSFLLMLAFVLPNMVRWLFFIAGYMFEPPEMSFDSYMCLSAQDPLGSGLWATGMLFSTLVPTALHLMFLIASPLAF
jgi:hypothetical protein